MSISRLLEDFGPLAHGNPISITDESLEETRLEAFENGYQAGWDDAAKAQTEDSRTISASLSQNLQDMEFTYQEAYTAVLTSLKPLLQQLVTTVLPEVARQSFGARLNDILMSMSENGSSEPFALVSSPKDMNALETMVAQHPQLRVTIDTDETLSEGQVFIRLQDDEREVNLTAVLQQIETLVADFFRENEKETA